MTNWESQLTSFEESTPEGGCWGCLIVAFWVAIVIPVGAWAWVHLVRWVMQ